MKDKIKGFFSSVLGYIAIGVIVLIAIANIVLFAGAGIGFIDDLLHPTKEVSIDELNGGYDEYCFLEDYELENYDENIQDIAWEAYQNGLRDGMERTVAINNYGEW